MDAAESVTRNVRVIPIPPVLSAQVETSSGLGTFPIGLTRPRSCSSSTAAPPAFAFTFSACSARSLSMRTPLPTTLETEATDETLGGGCSGGRVDAYVERGWLALVLRHAGDHDAGHRSVESCRKTARDGRGPWNGFERGGWAMGRATTGR